MILRWREALDTVTAKLLAAANNSPGLLAALGHQDSKDLGEIDIEMRLSDGCAPAVFDEFSPLWKRSRGTGTGLLSTAQTRVARQPVHSLWMDPSQGTRGIPRNQILQGGFLDQIGQIHAHLDESRSIPPGSVPARKRSTGLAWQELT